MYFVLVHSYLKYIVIPCKVLRTQTTLLTSKPLCYPPTSPHFFFHYSEIFPLTFHSVSLNLNFLKVNEDFWLHNIVRYTESVCFISVYGESFFSMVLYSLSLYPVTRHTFFLLSNSHYFTRWKFRPLRWKDGC